MPNKSFTPFLFTSDQVLYKNFDSWYVMWINPESVQINFGPPQSNQVQTRNGFAVVHWYNKLATISFSGQSGYVLWESARVQTPGSGSVLDALAKSFTDTFSQQNILKMWNGANASERAGLTLEQPQDPRDFINKLRTVVLSPMYYYDRNGFEHYNSKKLLVYTKQYPAGVTLDGFFNSFDIGEKATDNWTIPYNASFTVERGLIGSNPLDDLINTLGGIVNSFIKIA